MDINVLIVLVAVGLLGYAAWKQFVKKEKADHKDPLAPYKIEAPVDKVEAVNAQPVVAETQPAKPAAKAPAKKRTFVKREEGDVKSKVAKIKAPAKPKEPRKPRAKKTT